MTLLLSFRTVRILDVTFCHQKRMVCTWVRYVRIDLGGSLLRRTHSSYIFFSAWSQPLVVHSR